jgi:hypothetical protein
MDGLRNVKDGWWCDLAKLVESLSFLVNLGCDRVLIDVCEGLEFQSLFVVCTKEKFDTSGRRWKHTPKVENR